MSGAAERVRAAGGLYVADEVQSGFGRTGDHMWGFEADGVVPDIVVMAKGIGNGFPLGAVVAKKAIGDVMADKFMFHTYGANPTSCAAGRAVLQVIREEKTQENARIVGGALLARLKDLQQRHKAIGDVRGRGLMLAIEMVKDRQTKEPDADITAAVFENCREQGLILSKSGPHRSVLAHGAADVPVPGRCRDTWPRASTAPSRRSRREPPHHRAVVAPALDVDGLRAHHAGARRSRLPA